MPLPELVVNSPQPGARTALGTLTAAMTDTVGLSMAISAAAPAGLRGATGQFRVVVDSEIMLIAASATGASPWTIITRGAEGSTAATHLINAPVYHYLTAGALTTLLAVPVVPLNGTISTGSIYASNYLLSTDTQPAFSIKGDGTHSWGPGGSTAPDTTLARTAAATLTTNGSIYLRSGALALFANGTDTQSMFYVAASNGAFNWGPGGSTATDVSLSRVAAGAVAVGSGLPNSTGLLYVNQGSASGYTGGVVTTQTVQAAGVTFNNFQSVSNSVTTFYVRGDGHIYSTSTTVTSTSDAALKDDIKPLTGALTAIRALKPCSFTWNDHDINAARVGQEDYGLIAQEVEKVLPHLVGDDFQWKEGEDPLKSFRMGDLMPWVVAGMQEMMAEIETLRAKVA